MAYVDTQAREIILKVVFLGDPAACGAALRWLHESAGFEATRALVELQPEHEDETVLQFSFVPAATRADEYRYRLVLHAIEGASQAPSRRVLIAGADGAILIPPVAVDEARADARRAGLDFDALPKLVAATTDSALDATELGVCLELPVIRVDPASGSGLVLVVERLLPRVVAAVEASVAAPTVAAGTPVGYRRGS